jgi:hypothetical protein
MRREMEEMQPVLAGSGGSSLAEADRKIRSLDDQLRKVCVAMDVVSACVAMDVVLARVAIYDVVVRRAMSVRRLRAEGFVSCAGRCMRVRPVVAGRSG